MAELKTYSEQITEHIKAALLKGELKPGDKVNEARLASRLAISRAPVREALQMLVNDGLIVSIPQRGKYITALTAREIRDNYFIGGVLEGAAISSSVRSFSAGDFALLDSILEKMAALRTGDGYAEQFARADMVFHKTLLSRTDNRLIGEHSRNICQRMSKFLLFRHWSGAFTHEESVMRHRIVLEAVKSKDAWRIEKTLRAHYCELGERMAPFGKENER